MISFTDRAKRALKNNYRTFWLVVILFSFAFCLLGQMSLGFISFYQNHKGMAGDEISVFLEPGIKAEEPIKLITSQLDILAPGSTVKTVSAKDILEEDLLKLVGKKGKVPEIYAISFPIATPYDSIEKMVGVIEKVKGVSLVSANMDWIKKRYTLQEALALGVMAFGIPALCLVVLVYVLAVSKLNNSMKKDQALLLMQGGSPMFVCVPLMTASVEASLCGSAIGILLYFLSIYISVPFIEKAFEISLMPDFVTNILICIFLTAVLALLSAICAYITAGRTKPLTF